MFKAAALDPDDLINQLKRGYSGLGGPIGPLAPSIAGEDDPDADRASKILEGLDRMNLYRLAVEKSPFAMPLKTSFRYTSGFGRRWGRMHEGTDFAGAHGSPIYATADGTVGSCRMGIGLWQPRQDPPRFRHRNPLRPYVESPCQSRPKSLARGSDR